MSAALLAMLIAIAAPSAALTTRAASPTGAVALLPIAEVDLDGFAARAAAWSAARREHRAESAELALAAAADGRAAEAERIAAAEAARIAEEEARAEAARLAAVAATSTTTVAPSTSAPTTPDDASNPPATPDDGTNPPAEDPPSTDPPVDDVGGPAAAQWESLRQCESTGNYAAVSTSGRYRGAYQFSRATWDWVAGFTNPSLIGVDPAAASPADQDALALALWQARGWGPWPVCGAGL